MTIHLTPRVVRDEAEGAYQLQQPEGDGWRTRVKATHRAHCILR